MSVDGNIAYTGPGGVPFDNVALAMGGPNWRPAWVTYFDDFSFNGSPVPEPSALALLGVGGISLAVFAWRRKAARETANPAAFEQPDAPRS